MELLLKNSCINFNKEYNFNTTHYKYPENNGAINLIKSLDYNYGRGQKTTSADIQALPTPGYYGNFNLSPNVDSNANYPVSYADQSCGYRSPSICSNTTSPYRPSTPLHSPSIFSYQTIASTFSTVGDQSQPSVVDPKFPSETFDIPDIRDQGVEFSYNNPGYTSQFTNQYPSNFLGFQQPTQYLTNHHRVGSLVRYSNMDDPTALVASSEDSDDSLPLSQLTSRKTVTAKLAKKTKEKKPRKRKKKDPNEPQKPVSAYALFFRDTQAAIKGQKPNATFGEVSKIVASMWDSLDAVAKDTYKKKTENAKKEYLKKLAAYRASVISQQTPDQGLAEAAELAKAANEEEDKPVGKKAKMEAAPIAISSPSGSVNSCDAIELTEVTTDAANDSQPTTITVAENGIVTPSDGEPTLQTSVLKGQTIQIPRSLLEQAASKPISITVTQMSGEPGNQTKKVIKVMLPEKELHKLQSMKSSRSLLTTGAMVTGANSVTAPVSVPTAPVQEIKPVTTDENLMAEQKLPESDIMTTSEPDSLANRHADSVSMPEPVTMTAPEIDQQPITLCEFDSCSNPAIESPLWDNEYCSSQCVVNHCQDVFTAWVAARSATY